MPHCQPFIIVLMSLIVRAIKNIPRENGATVPDAKWSSGSNLPMIAPVAEACTRFGVEAARVPALTIPVPIKVDDDERRSHPCPIIVG